MLIVDSNYSKGKVKHERTVLLQRFIFLAIREVFIAFRVGCIFGGAMLFPSLEQVIADELQEWAFLSLGG